MPLNYLAIVKDGAVYRVQVMCEEVCMVCVQGNQSAMQSNTQPNLNQGESSSPKDFLRALTLELF
jgi:hypothetical protein